MVNLPTVALAALQPAGNNDEIFVWYQKQPGYAAFARASLSDARDGIVSTSAGVEEIDAGSDDVADLVKDDVSALAAGGGSEGDKTGKYEPFASSYSFTKAEVTKAVFVFGVRDDHQVCMISPTYEPLINADKAHEYSVAACGIPKTHNQKENVLIYYIWQENENKDPKLAEYSLLSPKQRRKVLPILPSLGSRLCAYHNAKEGKEYVFYVVEKTIHWRESRRGSTGNIHHTRTISEKSPMAICIYKTVPVLFFFSSDGVLMVTEYTQETWQESRAVSPTSTDHVPPDAHPNTDLAAVADRETNAIILYYREKNSENEYDSYVWKDPSIKNA